VSELDPTWVTRRRFLQCALSFPIVLAACRPQTEGATPTSAVPVTPTRSSEPAPATTAGAAPSTVGRLAPTPACDDGDEPTPSQTAGPFFTPDSPERAALLEPGMEGVRLVLAGLVADTGCRPVAGALLDFWQADAAGEYDNQGYRLRGHQFADQEGRFGLETVVPGNYGSRTRHIHVRVQAPNGPILTTQLYFPDEPRNEADGIFRPELLMDVHDAGDHQEAGFTFVLDLG
jgi:protocatechuate 3,4-dioxygenase beta subunit